MKLVIIGLGSIGTRHKNNLESLGHQVIPCHRGDNLLQLIKLEQPDGIFICNPTSLHLKTAKMAAGLPLFIEKPLSHNLNGVNQLAGKILVGYCLRWQPGLQLIKEQLSQEVIGKAITAEIVCSTYLPEWHPGTEYTQSYSAKKSLGGGVLLDLSHEIDYAVWFFGRAKTVSAHLQMALDLNIETEAIADLDIVFESGVNAKIHLDYVTKSVKRYCEIQGEKGNLSWQYPGPENMYLDEIKHFIDMIKNNTPAFVPLADAKHDLEIIDAAKYSSKSGKIVML